MTRRDLAHHHRAVVAVGARVVPAESLRPLVFALQHETVRDPPELQEESPEVQELVEFRLHAVFRVQRPVLLEVPFAGGVDPSPMARRSVHCSR